MMNKFTELCQQLAIGPVLLQLDCFQQPATSNPSFFPLGISRRIFDVKQGHGRLLSKLFQVIVQHCPALDFGRAGRTKSLVHVCEPRRKHQATTQETATILTPHAQQTELFATYELQEIPLFQCNQLGWIGGIKAG